jgi:hypothetical protein
MDNMHTDRWTTMHLKQASPRKKLLRGQWLTDVPRAARSLMSSSVKSVPWAIKLWVGRGEW